MATYFTFPFGPGQSTDNLTGLAAGQAKVLGAVGDGSLIFDIVVAPLQFMTGAGAVGTVELWLALSENNSSWSGGISATSASDQSSLLVLGQVRQLYSLSVSSATIYRFDEFSINNHSLVGFSPMYSCLIVRNNTTAAFNATSTNFAANYSRQNLSTPTPIVYA